MEATPDPSQNTQAPAEPVVAPPGGQPPAAPIVAPKVEAPEPPKAPEPKPTVTVDHLAAQLAALEAKFAKDLAAKDEALEAASKQVKDLAADRLAQKQAKRDEILTKLNPIDPDVLQWAPSVKDADPDTAEGLKKLTEWTQSKKNLFQGPVAPKPDGDNNGQRKTFWERDVGANIRNLFARSRV